MPAKNHGARDPCGVFAPGRRIDSKSMGRRLAILVLLLAACSGGCAGESEPAPQAAPGPSGAPDDGDGAADPQDADIALGPELTAAFVLISRGQTDAARARLEAHLAGHPDDGQARFLLGLTYHREKRYALARPHFEAAAELEPDYHPTYHFLGWCLYYLGDMPASRAAFEEHLRRVPGEGDSHFGLGLIALDEDRLADAEIRFRRAIELQASNPGRRRDVSKAHARLADVHIRRDELEAARRELETATALWPQHYTAFYKLSRVLNRLGERDAADEAFRQYRHWQAQAQAPRGVPGAPGVPGEGR